MKHHEYEDMQDKLSKTLHGYRCSNREESYDNGILAAKSILKRFSLIYGFDGNFNADEYVILRKVLLGKLKNGKGRYDDEYNKAINQALDIVREAVI